MGIQLTGLTFIFTLSDIKLFFSIYFYVGVFYGFSAVLAQ